MNAVVKFYSRKEGRGPGREEGHVCLWGCGGKVWGSSGVYLQMCPSYVSHTLRADLLRVVSNDYHQKTERL